MTAGSMAGRRSVGMKRTTVDCFTENGLRWRYLSIRWKTVGPDVSYRRAEGSRAGASNASE